MEVTCGKAVEHCSQVITGARVHTAHTHSGIDHTHICTGIRISGYLTGSVFLHSCQKLLKSLNQWVKQCIKKSLNGGSKLPKVHKAELLC